MNWVKDAELKLQKRRKFNKLLQTSACSDSDLLDSFKHVVRGGTEVTGASMRDTVAMLQRAYREGKLYTVVDAMLAEFTEAELDSFRGTRNDT